MQTQTNASQGQARRRRRQGLMALVVVQICFGLFAYFIHLAVGDAAGGHEGHVGFAPRAVAAWRIVFASLVLGLLAFKRHGRGVLPPRAELPRLATCALLGVVLNMTLAIEGTARMSVVNAVLLFTVIPVFTYGVALVARSERFVPLRILGIALSMGGAVVLILGSRGGVQAVNLGLDQVTGATLILINCLGYAIYLVLARPLLLKTDATLFLARVFGLSLIFVPALLWTSDALPPGLGSQAWVGMGYTLIFSTVLAYLLNAFALARVSSSTTAAFIYLQPLIGVAAGVFWRGEKVGSSAAVAAVLLFGGLGLVLKKRAA